MAGRWLRDSQLVAFPVIGNLRLGKKRASAYVFGNAIGQRMGSVRFLADGRAESARPGHASLQQTSTYLNATLRALHESMRNFDRSRRAIRLQARPPRPSVCSQAGSPSLADCCSWRGVWDDFRNWLIRAA
jgi:hypothetical protein